jgi:hypothetical protein
VTESEAELPDAERWVHGTYLGRRHRSLRRHLVEDHSLPKETAALLSDGGVHGLHDGRHQQTWAYAYDLPHPGLP